MRMPGGLVTPVGLGNRCQGPGNLSPSGHDQTVIRRSDVCPDGLPDLVTVLASSKTSFHAS